MIGCRSLRRASDTWSLSFRKKKIGTDSKFRLKSRIKIHRKREENHRN